MENVNYYLIIKYFHIVFVTTWMAGLFYLPRLFVYHSKVKVNSEEYRTFSTMEYKLLKYIMNPSLILSWFFGLLLVIDLKIYNELWLNLKFVFVALMSVFHMYCARTRKLFESVKNKNSERFFRWLNEIPTVLFLIIIFLVVFKPFV